MTEPTPSEPTPPDPLSSQLRPPDPGVALIDPDGAPLDEAAIAAAITAIAPFYDLDMGGLNEDLPLYRACADAAGPRVLELGVGSGRVAGHLLARGSRVVGIDANPAMLALARERLAGTDAVLVQGDIRCPPAHDALAPGAFDLVLAPLSGLGHLLHRTDQQAALNHVARWLRPGGWFVADLPAFDPRDWRPQAAVPQLQWTRHHPDRGTQVSKFALAEPAPGIQIQWITYMYDEVRSDGAVHRTLTRFPLRHIFRYEMEGLLEAAGLTLQRWFASYDLDDPSPEDAGERLIAVARRPEETA